MSLKRLRPSWYYVESGVVRGFVRIPDLLTGAEADAYVAEKGETNLAVATASKEPMENSAYTYTKTTVRSTVVGKQYALCITDGVNVREGRTEDARVVGVMKQRPRTPAALADAPAVNGSLWSPAMSGAL